MLPVRLVPSRLSNELPTGMGGLSRLTRDLDRLFGEAFEPTTNLTFPVDIRHEGDEWLIEAELPGLSRDDIEITVEDGVLTITGELKQSNEQEGAGYHLCERRHGKFSRSFKLPSTADGKQVNANLKQGILTLRIPTREEAKLRRIEVKST